MDAEVEKRFRLSHSFSLNPNLPRTRRAPIAMNNELDTILKTLERERGISRDVMLATIAGALQTAAKKSLGTSGDVRVEIDPHSLAIRAFERRVVDDGALGTGYITLADARRVNPEAQVGDTVETEVNPRIFGRIAAQTAKQVILQGMHESEREIMQRRYAGRVGEIVTATVRHTNHKDTLCDIQSGGEAILKGRDRLKSDRFNMGESFRAVIRFVGMEQDPRRLDDGESADGAPVVQNGRHRIKLIDEPVNNPCVKLSRTDKLFVRALFAEQSSEIKEGSVEIVEIARQPGVRTKVAVRTRNKQIDPVGACVGGRGARIRQVINELNGEKIDIVQWNPDIAKFAIAALQPALVKSVDVDEAAHHVTAYVESGALTPAIGKGGINSKLAAELIGWSVTVKELTDEGETEEQIAARNEAFRRNLEGQIAALADSLGIPQERAAAVAAHGFLTPDGIIETTLPEFVAQLGKAEEGDEELPVVDAGDARAVWIAAERLLRDSTAGAADEPATEPEPMPEPASGDEENA